MLLNLVGYRCMYDCRSHVGPSCQPGSAWPPAQLLCPVMEKEKKRKEKKEKKKEKRWRISRAASSNTVLAQNLRPRHRPAVTAPRGKLQPLAERPKKLQPAAVLAPRAQLQPLAERPEEEAATGRWQFQLPRRLRRRHCAISEWTGPFVPSPGVYWIHG